MATIDLPERSRTHLLHWYSEEFLESARVTHSSLFGRLFGLFGPHAVTINKTIHLTPQAPSLDSDSGIALLGHELFHVLQQEEAGWWRFLLRYLLHWRPAQIKQGSKHPLEAPAYQRQQEIRDSLRG